MHPVLALHLAAALLLVVAGLPKVLRPQSTLRAAADSGLPATAALVRLLGSVELALGLAALLVGGAPVALGIACCYGAFALLVARAVRRGGVSSCGCFAGDEAPPSWLHAGLDAALAGAVGWLAVSGPVPSLTAVAADSGAGPAGLLAAAATVDAWLLYVVMTRPLGVGNPTAARTRAAAAEQEVTA